MSTNSTTTWSSSGYVDTMGATEGSLYIHPNGMAGDQFTIYRRKDVSDAEMLAVADRVLSAVQRWRDRIAEHTEQNRTTADELAAARAEIARLKGEEVQV
ncbi:hypothetical protein TR51_06395 [Kitasatospora griseola]|uniref:Uncharacterized protein n=1 Tax=Kitasatospora griseola TaxID=2064 RepID=A0A0D0Q378_KITGR|nr:hypothetical protein [Kitasatospora griseola]KIQ67017.1 hypothetical protein TR51_06395 [Kitasatospora griseola]